MPVYRYKSVDPSRKQSRLQRLVPNSINSVTSIQPANFVDVDVDAASKEDLDASMATKGYVYVETAPSNTPQQASHLDYAVIPSAEKGAVNGVATLDGSGDIPLAQLPPHAATHVENAADELNAEDLGAVDAGVPGKVMITTGSGGWTISDAAIISALPAELNFDENFVLASTTSNTPVLDLRLTTNQSDPAGLIGGSYIIFAQGTLSGTQNGTVIGAETVLDAGTGGEEILNTYQGRPGSNQGQLPFFSHAVRVLAAGVHTIDINFYRASGGGSAEIEQARITLWRVAE